MIYNPTHPLLTLFLHPRSQIPPSLLMTPRIPRISKLLIQMT